MRLYSFWRSSAAYRVRIALALKGIACEAVAVPLAGGAQHDATYAALNPQQLVPTLVLDDGTVLTQSLAIIDYLEAMHPTPPLLPADPVARAHVIAAAHSVAMDIHPLNNLRLLGELEARFGASAADKQAWMAHWMTLGFAALERMVTPSPFAFGTSPSLADICLIPQLYNARRWQVDVAPYPRLTSIEAACLSLPAFQAAAPDAQPDAPQTQD
ncbi:maleylpyruvate isomerase [mine drainage metagenome]|uniref:Maleylpyruvate isomerase n=1 Tax=mine drainage metagenome TaxID=410659 RepID=A0A1J5PWL0_9ZZZZ